MGANSYGPVYSTPNSLGIVIATGNVGENLIWVQDKENSFFKLKFSRKEIVSIRTCPEMVD